MALTRHSCSPSLTFADISQVNRMNLSKYSHIVLNHGRYNELSGEKLKQYVEAGGTLIALGDGATWASRNKIGNATFKATVGADTKGKSYLMLTKRTLMEPCLLLVPSLK